MKLIKVNIINYKSFTNQVLDISHNCMGFVGINESGKSNLLNAIELLNKANDLSNSDSPKQFKKTLPEIHFSFNLDAKDLKLLNETIDNWLNQQLNSKIEYSVFNGVSALVIVKLDEKGMTTRKIVLEKVQMPKDILVHKSPIDTDFSKLIINNQIIEAKRQQVISKEQLNENNKISIQVEELRNLESDLESINSIEQDMEADISEMSDQIENGVRILEDDREVELSEVEFERIKKEFEKKKNDLEKVKEVIKNKKEKSVLLHKEFSNFKIETKIEELKSKLAENNRAYKAKEDEKNNLIKSINGLTKSGNVTIQQQKEIDGKKKIIDKLNSENSILQSNSDKISNQIEISQLPLNSKYLYSEDKFNEIIHTVVENELEILLPPVIRWENSENFILKSETNLVDILNTDNINNLPRPLINIFRIGLGIKKLEELKVEIKEIIEDSSERSRKNDILNKKLKSFLENVWPDYEPELKVALEKDIIRVQITNPNAKDSSYFSMEERSQGAKAFLSFLLTVGAEARNDVLQNSILLLDEPESHLHPSGAKHMLKELLKVAEKNNTVLYATHSQYLFDDNDYSRHSIIKKVGENSKIIQSTDGRIGFFMQEEVLYKAIDAKVDKLISVNNKFNFVMEGNADAYLFEKFLNLSAPVQKKASKPNANPKVFDVFSGGGCSNIEKYLYERPLQLGTKWFFILDKDKPADDLCKFINGYYKDYIGKEIFIFQYGLSEKHNSDIELEDLLPKNILLEVLIDSAEMKDLDSNIILYEKDKIDFMHCLKNLCSYEIEDFKGLFKSNLNRLIKSKTETINSIEGFAEAFPIFHNFISTSIEKQIPFLNVENIKK